MLASCLSCQFLHSLASLLHLLLQQEVNPHCRNRSSMENHTSKETIVPYLQPASILVHIQSEGLNQL
ncbi:hypothetical protein FGO68_gene3548 [Halteria grandinella]|uniref:Uncharacterized protein n=1 Tax=Halteria grandinella TaxID=5974 RepID=A0A8J8T8F4_HALGN|nr:hypothetical protein FGO68_gene3548 [Halteria grandinella]